MIGYEDNLQLTAKQVSGVRRIERLLEESHGVEASWLWDFALQPEVRPGRGNDARFYGFGDELIVGGTIDVYGNFDYWIADLVIVHSSADEECRCVPCREFAELEEMEDAE